MADIETMQKELEAAGYVIYLVDYVGSQKAPMFVTPDGLYWQGDESEDITNGTRNAVYEQLENKAIEKAHAHLQASRRAAELEAFIQELSEVTFSVEEKRGVYTGAINISLAHWVQRAKALRGEE